MSPPITSSRISRHNPTSSFAGDQGISKLADETIEIPGAVDEWISPLLLTLPFQLLGYYLGLERGGNPDALRSDSLSHAVAWLTAFPLPSLVPRVTLRSGGSDPFRGRSGRRAVDGPGLGPAGRTRSPHHPGTDPSARAGQLHVPGA